MTDLRFVPARSALLIVDVQERLAAAMSASALAACERNILILIELARRLQIPIVCSEQYPKGLGSTVSSIRTAIAAMDVHRMEKVEFGCTESPAFADVRTRVDRDDWVVVGMETHVCVYLTTRGLRESGAKVFVPADAVISRTAANVAVGLDLMARSGAIVTCTETLVFDALTRAGGDDFKAMSRLVR